LTAFFTTADVAHATSSNHDNHIGSDCKVDRKSHDRKDGCCTSSDCDRNQFCGTDLKCYDRPDFCGKDYDCNDAEACGSDRRCHDRPGYCKSDSDCKSSESCNSDHKCHKRSDECTTDEQCDNGKYCGTNKKCQRRSKCDDLDACTIDNYEGGGKCSHTRIDGCCRVDADCDDSNPATVDTCSDGICNHDSPPPAPQCTTDVQCDDGNVCTTDACVSQACTYTAIPGCGAEVCNDGIDNDGDGATDCSDSDCAADPSCVTPPPPVEICGDCLDNDNNGLTDFEDPACCDQSYAMVLSRGRVVPNGATSRMRIKSMLAKSGLSTINPTQQDVFLQIRPAGSHDILCARVPAAKFMARRKTFKYWSKMSSAASAQGIGDMKIRVKKDGSVRLITVSKHVKLSNAKAGAWQITVGFHGGSASNRCSSTMASFGAKKNALLAY
jgi:hypothetical protein